MTRAVGLGLAAAGAAAWACTVATPWLLLPGEGAELGTRDLLRSDVGYEQGIALCALAGLPMAVAAALALAMRTGPTHGVRDRWLAPALAAGALGALAATVAGARLTGFALVRLLDPGQAVIAPGPAPLAAFVAGAALAAWLLTGLRRAGAPLPAPTVAAAATLAAMPFLPFGVSGDGSFLYDELTLAAAVASSGGDAFGHAGQALAWSRGALWGATLAGAGLCAAQPWLPARRAPVVRAAAVAPWCAAALALAGLTLWRWASVDGLGLCWNAALPLGTAAAAGTALAPLVRRRGARPRVAPERPSPVPSNPLADETTP